MRHLEGLSGFLPSSPLKKPEGGDTLKGIKHQEGSVLGCPEKSSKKVENHTEACC